MTAKQQKFVDEYCKTLNATDAAIKAGYSKRSPMERGYELRQKPSVKKAIEKRLNKLSKKAEIAQERIVEELACVATANMVDAVRMNPDGSIEYKPLEEWPDNLRRAVHEIQMIQLSDGNGLSMKVKLIDKTKALTALAKIKGMMIEKHQHQVDLNVDLVHHLKQVEDYVKYEREAKA